MEPLQPGKPTFGAMILTFLFNGLLLIHIDAYTKYASALSLTLMSMYYCFQMFLPSQLKQMQEFIKRITTKKK